jgi:hypothetical protein
VQLNIVDVVMMMTCGLLVCTSGDGVGVVVVVVTTKVTTPCWRIPCMNECPNGGSH